MKTKMNIFVSVLLLQFFAVAHAMEASTHGYQKPGLPIRLQAPALTNVQAGDTVPLHYQFMSPLSEGNVLVRVSVDEGLQHTAAEVYSFDLAEDVFALDFEVQAQQNGVYYIRFMVELGDQFRALGHRIRVGEIEKSELQKPNDFIGGVRSMPARETIKTK